MVELIFHSLYYIAGVVATPVVATVVIATIVEVVGVCVPVV